MLTDLYQTLCQTIPEDGAAMFGLPVVGDYPYWLAIDAQAYPALLLPARADDLRPDIKLRAVDTLFSRNCVIATDTPLPHEGYFSLIRLKDSDPAIVRLFLRILEESFSTASPPISNANIAARVQQIAALFSRIEDNTRDLVGLWGELAVIAHARNTDAAVRCWSTRKTAKYDFIAEHFVLDVKTTTKPAPKHRFSLDQLRPSGAFDAYIASLCVIEVQSGQTVVELMETIAARISDQELRSAFLIQCLAKGGRDLYHSDLVLQTYPDNTSLDIFRAEDIPVPHIRSCDPIENIRFDVDLSGLASLPDHIRTSVLEFEAGE
ncbi:PD-(D/E)XK motif protein [Salaquimonas pukyongi]|uniref:PD-(D/E)XK motif protein n=1 Tax=Salaquimonas pukyongi TaxID=2712698 RepID=UPI00096BA1CF|nr:PD-(D/E)XK motif protein [Salaquimonas pukyongi]